ncbi:RNA polymerase sigma factor [Arachidicoccus ginsenosidimutans]|uniref:RNA polymerase sigma factor n=1 Tax=Arachidicoccus sp. BS20 TaxID=1850526 RepID=UPI0009ED0674|nr:sigma-70 family RNA polymerase sigma factor [Arachidicoccus sp. BS20]
MKSGATEQQLLDGLAKGDRQAIEVIYENNFNTILSLIINNNGSYDDAKDIFQEALVILYEKVQTGNFQLSSRIKTYLYAVSRKLWLKKLQLQGRYYISSDVDLEEHIFTTEDADDARQKDADFSIMENALNKLGEPCKSLLEAFYIQKKGMSELAEMFGYTNTDNAKTQKYKCLMRLKKLFFAQYKK